MLPLNIKHTNCASPLGGKNMREYFDLSIKRANVEDMVASCITV